LVKHKLSFLSYVNLVCDKFWILGWILVVSSSSFLSLVDWRILRCNRFYLCCVMVTVQYEHTLCWFLELWNMWSHSYIYIFLKAAHKKKNSSRVNITSHSECKFLLSVIFLKNSYNPDQQDSSKPQEVSHLSNPSSVPQGILDSYSTLPWVTWEVVTFVEVITWWGLLWHMLANGILVYRSQRGRYRA